MARLFVILASMPTGGSRHWLWDVDGPHDAVISPPLQPLHVLYPCIYVMFFFGLQPHNKRHLDISSVHLSIPDWGWMDTPAALWL